MPDTTVLHIKVKKEAIRKFGEKAKANGRKTTDLLRDIIDAVNEGRATITPTDGQKELFGLTGEDK